MVYGPAAGGGKGGETIAVDTTALKATAPTFRQTGQQVSTLKQTLDTSVQMGAGEMFMVMEFSKLASLLEQLESRIGMAMQCAAGGLNRIGTSLEIGAGLYEENEDVLGSSFSGLEDDKMPWNIGIHLPPDAITMQPGGGGSQPQTPTQPQTPLNPGLKKPQQPSPNPLPWPIINPLEP